MLTCGVDGIFTDNPKYFVQHAWQKSNEMKHILALDLGTTNVRAVLFDEAMRPYQQMKWR